MDGRARPQLTGPLEALLSTSGSVQTARQLLDFTDHSHTIYAAGSATACVGGETLLNYIYNNTGVGAGRTGRVALAARSRARGEADGDGGVVGGKVLGREDALEREKKESIGAVAKTL